MAITTTKQLRKFLAQQLEEAAAGRLDHNDGRNVIGLANQITSNMQAELKTAELHLKMGKEVDKFGALDI